MFRLFFYQFRHQCLILFLVLFSCSNENESLEKNVSTNETSLENAKESNENSMPALNWRNPVMNSYGSNLGQYIRAFFMVGEFERIIKFIHFPSCYDKEEITYLLRNAEWGYNIDFTNIHWERDSSFVLSYKIDKNNTVSLEQYKGKIINDTAKLFFYPNKNNPFKYTGKDEFETLCDLKNSMSNILFEFNSDKFVSSSIQELEKIKTYFLNNPMENGEIIGHTSSEGSSAYNKTLSLSRAKAVYTYLTDSGIDKKRLKFDGKGDAEPIYPNDTEDKRMKNRRVELKLLE